MKKQIWTPEEDEILQEIVNNHGSKNWRFIATHLPNRTPIQCRDRWTNRVNPAINREPFRQEEDELLMRLVKRYGSSWSSIASHFPRRTDCAIKNRYCVLQRRHVSCRRGRSSLANSKSAASGQPSASASGSDAEPAPCTSPRPRLSDLDARSQLPVQHHISDAAKCTSSNNPIARDVEQHHYMQRQQQQRPRTIILPGLDTLLSGHSIYHQSPHWPSSSSFVWNASSSSDHEEPVQAQTTSITSSMRGWGHQTHQPAPSPPSHVFERHQFADDDDNHVPQYHNHNGHTAHGTALFSGPCFDDSVYESPPAMATGYLFNSNETRASRSLQRDLSTSSNWSKSPSYGDQPCISFREFVSKL